MSWEALTAVASLITAAVIAVTAIIALVQIRHLRTANQLNAALKLYDEVDDADFRKVRTFVQTELGERMKSAAFRDELLNNAFDRDIHLEVRLGNYWEKYGLLIRTRLLEKNLFLDWGAQACLRDWRVMREVTKLLRVKSPEVWRDFEFLARLASVHLDQLLAHPMRQPKWQEGLEELDIRGAAAPE
jgi:hypothetical protein